jgi:hypothetical protein
MLKINFNDIYFFLYAFVFLPLFSLNGCDCDDENDEDPVFTIYSFSKALNKGSIEHQASLQNNKTKYKKGDIFEEKVIALDGNDLSRKATLERTNVVDTSRVGTYRITYKATNKTQTQKKYWGGLFQGCKSQGGKFNKTDDLIIDYSVVERDSTDGDPPTKYDCGLSRNPDTDPSNLYPSNHPKFPNCLKTKGTCYNINSMGQSQCDVNCVDIIIGEERAYKCEQAFRGTGDSQNETGPTRSLSEKPNHIHNHVDNNKSYINTDSELPSHNYLFVREDNEEVKESPFNKLTIIVNEIESILGDILSISNFFNKKNLTKNMVIETYNNYFDEKFD